MGYLIWVKTSQYQTSLKVNINSLSSRRRHPEKSVSVHLHLAGALLCLHLCFLLCGFWVLVLKEEDEGWVCRGLGLLLHWSLLATFFWMALEGFHLYLLLVRVFNIYIKKYVLKLCLLAWGEETEANISHLGCQPLLTGGAISFLQGLI